MSHVLLDPRPITFTPCTLGAFIKAPLVSDMDFEDAVDYFENNKGSTSQKLDEKSVNEIRLLMNFIMLGISLCRVLC